MTVSGFGHGRDAGHWAPLWALDASGKRGRAPRALLLDSDPALCRQMGLALRSLGIECDSCSSADEALARARGHRYQVAVVDVALDRGLEVARTLSQGRAGRRVPVVAFAAGGSLRDRLRARWNGCAAFVSKPAPLERFLSTVWRTACAASSSPPASAHHAFC